MDKLYFAHPINTYNTPIEERVLGIIREKFPAHEIVNPNSPEHAAGYTCEGMGYFTKLVNGTKVTVILPFSNGAVGAGIGTEAAVAFSNGSEVYFIRPPALKIEKIHTLSDLVILSIEETRTRLKSRVPEYF